jgi:hypothetical protein
MSKHPKGKTGASLSGWVSGRKSNWTARQKRLLARQRRLSGECKLLYDRDTGNGAIPPNLHGDKQADREDMTGASRGGNQ